MYKPDSIPSTVDLQVLRLSIEAGGLLRPMEKPELEAYGPAPAGSLIATFGDIYTFCVFPDGLYLEATDNKNRNGFRVVAATCPVQWQKTEQEFQKPLSFESGIFRSIGCDVLQVEVKNENIRSYGRQKQRNSEHSFYRSAACAQNVRSRDTYANENQNGRSVGGPGSGDDRERRMSKAKQAAAGR